MKQCLTRVTMLLLIISLVSATGCGGESGINGKYTHVDDLGSYLELKPDHTVYMY